MGSKSSASIYTVKTTKDSVLFGTHDGVILEYSLETGNLKRNFVGHTSAVCRPFFVNETLFITGAYDGNIILWDLASGKRLRTYTKSIFRFRCVVYRNGVIYAGTAEGPVALFDFDTGKFIRQLTSGIDSGIVSLIVTDHYLFAGEDINLNLNMWDLSTNELVRKFSDIDGYVLGLYLDGNYLYACQDFGSILGNTLKFDINTGDLVFSYPKNTGGECLLKDNFLYSRHASLLTVTNISSNLVVFQSPISGIAAFDLYEDYFITDNVYKLDWNNSSLTFEYKLPANKIGWVQIAITENYLYSTYFDGSIRKIDLTTENWKCVTQVGTINPSLYIVTVETSLFFTLYGNLVEYSIENDTLIRIVDFDCTIYLYKQEKLLLYAKTNLDVVQVDLANDSMKKILNGSVILDVTASNVFLYISTSYVFIQGYNNALRIEIASHAVQQYLGFTNMVVSFCDTIFGYVFGSYNAEIMLFDRSNEDSVRKFLGHESSVNSCAAEDNILYTGSEDTYVIAWDLRSGAQLKKFTCMYYRLLYCVAQISTVYNVKIYENTLYVSTRDGILLYDTSSSRLLNVLSDRTLSVQKLFYNGDNLEVARLGGLVEFWNVEQGSLEEYKKYGGDINVEFCFVQQKIFWSFGAELHADDGYEKLGSHSDDITSIYCDENFVISGDENGGLKIWNSSSESNIASTTANGNQSINTIILTLNDIFYVAGNEGFIEEWQGLQNPVKLRRFNVNSLPIYALELSNDYLFSSGADKTIKRWSLSSGILIMEYKRMSGVPGHLGSVNAIIVRNGYLFSVSGDLTAKIWSVKSGKVLETLIGPYQRLNSLLLMQNYLVCGGDDQFIFVYSLDEKYTNVFTTEEMKFSTSSQESFKIPFISSSALQSNFAFAYYILIIVGSCTIIAVIMWIILYGSRLKMSINNIISELNRTTLIGQQTFTLNTTNFHTSTLINTNIGLSGHLSYKSDASYFEKLDIISRGGQGEVQMVNVSNQQLSKQFGTIAVQKIYYKNRDAKEIHLKEISMFAMFRQYPYFAVMIAYTEDPLSIIMKFYPEGSLDKWIKTKKMNTKSAWNLSLDISKAIEVMHQHDMAHCDIKTENVLLEIVPGIGPKGYLTDFGISQVLSSRILAVKTLNLLKLRGISVAYAGPESLRKSKLGQSWEFAAGDIYSFGVVLYSMITRKKPWIECD